MQERIRFYDERVLECVDRLRGRVRRRGARATRPGGTRSSTTSGSSSSTASPELAETFFNSVITRILQRTYYDNDLIFVRAAISTEYIESDPPIYRSYYPSVGEERECFARIFRDFGWSRPFADLDGDLDHLLHAIEERPGGPWTHLEPNYQIQVLSSALYRNKAAYVFGKLVNGHDELPFVVPVLHGTGGRLVLDTILLDPEQINILFSASRAYFQVDMEVPSGYVEFLHSMAPLRASSELYTMIGLGKQGKTLFFRELLQHLHHSRDQFVEAPGIRGQVMLVFTLPSYPYVFKVIRDVFGPGKDTDRATVRSKFTMVKHVDRVGRLADTLEFIDLALPRERFSAELLEQLHELAPSMVSDSDPFVIRHCYVERRMVPLNLYLDRASPEELEAAVVDYGNAIRDLAAANIFPGDMLWRNFGVTSYGRVVFYDYDEIDYLSDVNFRRDPAAAGHRRGARGRAVVRRHAQRRLPRGVRVLPARRPAPARALPPPPRRPARAGGLAGRPAPNRARGADGLLPVPGVAPLLQSPSRCRVNARCRLRPPPTGRRIMRPNAGARCSGSCGRRCRGRTCPSARRGARISSRRRRRGHGPPPG